MQAVLLAAGRSKRFEPLGDKNFFSLGGQFLIERQVATLKKAGIKKIIIVANKDNAERIQKLFPKYEVLIQKNLSEGMRGAVLTVEKWLTVPTLICSTNDVVEVAAIKKVLAAKKCASLRPAKSGASPSCDGVLLAQKVEDYFPGGYLKVGKGKIFSVVEKPKQGKEPSNLINLVFHLFKEPQKLVAELKKASNKRDDGYERALAQLFKKQTFVAVENPASWQAVKYPWHALELTQHFLKAHKNKISKKAQIAKTAIIEGNTVVEDGAKIFDYAIVKDSYIGKNAVVGNHSLVRESVVEEQGVVGGSSEVARSYIGAHSWLHRNYVGDSIIKENVGLGSGAVCANLRLDEENINIRIDGQKINCGSNKFGCGIGRGCRIGVNTSIMPGVLIGEHSFVGSGLVVEKNVGFQTFFTAVWESKAVKNKKSAGIRGKLK